MKTVAIIAAAAATLSTMAEARAFTLKLATSGSWDNLPLVAWNGMFIAALPGNSTTATCPPWDTNCPGAETTILSGPTLEGAPTQLWMGVLQEHGQRVYTHEPPKGLFEYQDYGDLISYTAAGTTEDANKPKVDNYGDLWNILEYDFDYSYGAKQGDHVLAHGPDNSTFFGLCSAQYPWGGQLLILSTVSKYCGPVNVRVEETDVAAPQFYNCDGCEFRGSCDSYPSCDYPFCSRDKKLWFI
ncbi:hypothetical protein D6C93_07045 [Aureobasidium pullulans]|nr:hypothetical protein D6C93_07045 [Aureobasidium pullulans]